MNCKITVERYGSISPTFNHNKGLTHKEFEFDDYRVVIAIENLLENISGCLITTSYYDPKKENTDND